METAAGYAIVPCDDPEPDIDFYALMDAAPSNAEDVWSRVPDGVRDRKLRVVYFEATVTMTEEVFIVHPTEPDGEESPA